MASPWSYRIENLDGPSRIGSFQRDSLTLGLPVILDRNLEDGPEGPIQHIIPIGEGWDGHEVKMIRDPTKSGPHEPVLDEAFRRKGMDRMRGAVVFHRWAVLTDGEPLPAVVASPAEILGDDPRSLARLLSSLASSSIGPPFLIPDLAGSDNLEVLFYLGQEIFDTTRAHLDAAGSIYHTMEGSLPLEIIRRRSDPAKLCGCRHCASGLADVASLGSHNVVMMARRLSMAVTMAEEGRLRELVMGRLSGKPSWAALIRRCENGGLPHVMERALTYRKPGPVPVTYKDDLSAPDFRLWASRIRAEYMPPQSRSILLLLPCSARKPYSLSRTHSRIRAALSRIKGWMDHCQQLVLTSPLGVVPMELEMLYPASYYDIPVTGEWFPEEMDLMKELVRAVSSHGVYDSIVCHHPEGASIFTEEIELGRMGGIPFVNVQEPEGLAEILREETEKLGRARTWGQGVDISSLLRFSLGVGIDDHKNLRFRERADRIEILHGKYVLAEMKQGGPVPTFGGGKVLWEMEQGKRVIIDDFKPRGTVFTQGIHSADPSIRTGDVVLVGTDSEFRAVGRAGLPGVALTSGTKGPGIRVLNHK